MAGFRERIEAAARRGLNQVQERVSTFEREGGINGLTERVRREFRTQQQALLDGPGRYGADYFVLVRQWYARLELQFGAGPDEVQRAYRRLMRQYHPDRFAANAEEEALATRLSQELTVAYEGLMRHLA